MSKISLKNIKEMELEFENLESVFFPYECFKKFECELKDDNHMEKIRVVIEDNGKSRYEGTYGIETMKSPTERIFSFRDISSLTIIYKDNIRRHFVLPWEDDEFEEFSNKFQKAELLSYKKVYVEIATHIETYCLQQIFSFPDKSKFKIINDENGYEKYKSGLFIIDNGILIFEPSYEELGITKETVNFKFILVND